MWVSDLSQHLGVWLVFWPKENIRVFVCRVLQWRALPPKSLDTLVPKLSGPVASDFLSRMLAASLGWRWLWVNYVSQWGKNMYYYPNSTPVMILSLERNTLGKNRGVSGMLTIREWNQSKCKIVNSPALTRLCANNWRSKYNNGGTIGSILIPLVCKTTF